ncbi:cyanophycinase [Paraflavitalea pollutisoli]|uniref:cyanophycinase n=1 Tax=Paraflavitalea pollutisoli TaxID=3034143 RepID=UPI0023EB9DC3|nr:cyanophycinase [Paraflavitalea sp. H1-2-19X]
MRNSSLLAALLLAGGAALAQAGGSVGNGLAANNGTAAAARTTSAAPGGFVGPERGTLVIVGGGKLGPEIWNRFIEAAGGVNAHIVVIPTAGDDSAIARGRSSEKEALEALGVKDVTILHTRDPKVANTDAFVAPLKKATGVWFNGGRQWKIADAYLHTKSHEAFKDVLARGGVIGGTSAGATIQGAFLFRGDTKGNTILVGDHLEGLDFIHNVAIDQHVLRRNRQFDLIGLIKEKPELLGIGIDESTAIVVQQNTFEVIGASYVAIYDAARFGKQAPATAANSNTGTVSGDFFFLGKGQKYDLLGRQVIDRPRGSEGQ